MVLEQFLVIPHRVVKLDQASVIILQSTVALSKQLLTYGIMQELKTKTNKAGQPKTNQHISILYLQIDIYSLSLGHRC